MAIVGTLGYNFQSVLPLLARFTFDGGPSTYAVLVAAMGLGAIIGALVNGARGSVTRCSWSAPRRSSGSSRCWPRALRRSRSRSPRWRRSAPPP